MSFEVLLANEGIDADGSVIDFVFFDNIIEIAITTMMRISHINGVKRHSLYLLPDGFYSFKRNI